MHSQQQTKRRKKRPMHGVKTVQVSRGKSGYGFTISGQHPCVLSCIVNGSPAEQMGLKPGDYVMSVNSENVSRASHDYVVRMVGLSTGMLELQVAENLNDSDSSEEEYHPRIKSRFPNRVRPRQQQILPPKVPESHRSHNKLETKGTNCKLNVCSPEHVSYNKDSSHSSGNRFAGPHLKTSHSSQSLKSVNSASNIQNSLSNSHSQMSQNSLSYVSYNSLNSQNNSHNSQVNVTQSSRSNLRSNVSQHKPNLHNNVHSDVNRHHHCHYEDMNFAHLPLNIPAGCLPSDGVNSDNSEHSGLLNDPGEVKAVVGYIGSIEMPSDANRPHQRLQSLRNAVRRLRIEKKIHTLVLMDVQCDGVKLKSTTSKMIAYYPADKIAFSGVCPDDKRFFGIVTLHDHSDDISEISCRNESTGTASSCHIFMVDAEMKSHNIHAQKAKSFSIICTVDPNTRSCLEFPRSCTHIILAVANLYKDRQGDNCENDIIQSQAFANPTRQAQRSSSNSSNSDSGLGFGKDDTSNDRVFVVDMPSEESGLSRPNCVQSQNSKSKVHHLSPDIQTMPSAKDHFKRPCSAFELRKVMNNSTSSEEYCNISANKLNPRAMPNPHRSWRTDGFDQHHHNNASSENLRQSMRNLLQQRKAHSENSSDESCKNDFVKGKFISPRPRSAPFTQLSSLSDKVETVDLNRTRLSPRSYCRNKAMLRSPSAPPIPYFHPDDFDDSDTDSEDDPMVRKVIQRFNQDKTLFSEQDQRRFSESFAVATKREKERSDNHHVQRWRKTASFRRNKPLKHPCQSHESLIVSDVTNHRLLPANSVNSIVHQVNKIEEDDDAGRVAGWAVNFEKLLQDDSGIAVFTDFLKKEFSEENIIFWIACKDYKNIVVEEERKMKAKEIYNHHISTRATDPVNVDSSARLHADKFIDIPNSIMFDLAQQQIFQLMKTDSYVRFLKSELYKTYLLREIEGVPLDLPVLESAVKPTGDKKKKGKENEEKSRRRSLLPWKQYKTKTGKSSSDSEIKRLGKLKGSKEDVSKSIKERKEEHVKKLPGPGIDLSTMRKEVFSTKETVAEKKEQNEGEFKFCRVIMPDGSTTVVCAKPGQSTRSVLGKLCEKRNLSIASVDVFLLGCDKPLDLSEDISLLGSKEVIIERRVLFRMDLPNKKSIGVKAKPNRTIRDVFKPILNKYGYRVDQVGVQLSGGSDLLDLEMLVSEVDNQRIIIISKDDLTEWGGNERQVLLAAKPPLVSAKFATKANLHTSASLEEITNGIFEDLMKGKSENIHKFDDLGVLIEFDNGTKLPKNLEGNLSSGLSGLRRKESWGNDVNKLKVRSKVNFARPKIEKSKKMSDQEDEKLFELLRKAQSQRLDDQRGLTTCSVEIPEFLRQDEEDDQWQASLTPDDRRGSSVSDIFDEITFSPNTSIKDGNKLQEISVFGFGAHAREINHFQTFGSSDKIVCSNDSFGSEDSVHPNPQKADNYFSMKPVIVDSKAIILSDIQKEIDKSQFYFHQRANINKLAPVASPEQYVSHQTDLDKTLVSQPFLTPSPSGLLVSSNDVDIANFTPPTPVKSIHKLQHSETSGFKVVNKNSKETVNNCALKDKSNILLQTPPSYQSLINSGKISVSPKILNFVQPKVYSSDIDSENPIVTFV